MTLFDLQISHRDEPVRCAGHEATRGEVEALSRFWVMSDVPFGEVRVGRRITKSLERPRS